MSGCPTNQRYRTIHVHINKLLCKPLSYSGSGNLVVSLFLSFHHVLNVICSFLGNSPASSSNCRCFGTHYRFHLHRQVNEVCQWMECVGYLYLIEYIIVIVTLFVLLCVCVCVYIYIYIYIYMHMHANIPITTSHIFNCHHTYCKDCPL